MQPGRRRRIISSRGHRLSEDTDFPLGPSRHWCQVTLFLLCYQRQTSLRALTEPASASRGRPFKAFAPEKQDKNGSGFSGMQTGRHFAVTADQNRPYTCIQAAETRSHPSMWLFYRFGGGVGGGGVDEIIQTFKHRDDHTDSSKRVKIASRSS